MSSPPLSASSSTPRYHGEQVALAMQILVSPHITFAEGHVSGNKDFAYPAANLLKSIFMLEANRSCYGSAPCGEVRLSLPLLRGMLELAKSYDFHVTEIAGGEHSRTSRHYKGVAFDVDRINGVAVSVHNEHVRGFEQRCRAFGATEVLGPGHSGHDHHVHCAWPRPLS